MQRNSLCGVVIAVKGCDSAQWPSQLSQQGQSGRPAQKEGSVTWKVQVQAPSSLAHVAHK